MRRCRCSRPTLFPPRGCAALVATNSRDHQRLLGRDIDSLKSALANTDARVVKVMVELDAASSAIAARFTNLEVIARIDTNATPKAEAVLVVPGPVDPGPPAAHSQLFSTAANGRGVAREEILEHA